MFTLPVLFALASVFFGGTFYLLAKRYYPSELKVRMQMFSMFTIGFLALYFLGWFWSSDRLALGVLTVGAYTSIWALLVTIDIVKICLSIKRPERIKIRN